MYPVFEVQYRHRINELLSIQGTNNFYIGYAFTIYDKNFPKEKIIDAEQKHFMLLGTNTKPAWGIFSWGAFVELGAKMITYQQVQTTSLHAGIGGELSIGGFTIAVATPGYIKIGWRF